MWVVDLPRASGRAKISDALDLLQKYKRSGVIVGSGASAFLLEANDLVEELHRRGDVALDTISRKRGAPTAPSTAKTLRSAPEGYPLSDAFRRLERTFVAKKVHYIVSVVGHGQVKVLTSSEEKGNRLASRTVFCRCPVDRINDVWCEGDVRIRNKKCPNHPDQSLRCG
jgi:hypothetical protein